MTSHQVCIPVPSQILFGHLGKTLFGHLGLALHRAPHIGFDILFDLCLITVSIDERGRGVALLSYRPSYVLVFFGLRISGNYDIEAHPWWSD